MANTEDWPAVSILIARTVPAAHGYDDWASMEAAWASRQGALSDADLETFTDLSRTTWSAVDEIIVLE